MHHAGSDMRLDQPRLFVVLGDVARIECDAWLLSTDDRFHVTAPFRPALGLDTGGDGKLPDREWRGSSILRWGRGVDGHGPQIWLGRAGLGEGEWSERLTAVASEFVEHAEDEARAASSGRYPVVALPAIGTGHGGARSHKGELCSVADGVTDLHAWPIVPHGSPEEVATPGTLGSDFQAGTNKSWRQLPWPE